MHDRFRLVLALLVWSIAGFSPALAVALPFSQNLIVNGDAESDTGSTTGSTIGPVTGFTTVSNFTVVKYGVAGGFPLATDPGPVNRGSNYFAGGPSNLASSASQLLNVSSIASSIDLGSIQYQLSGFLGGFSAQGDNAVLTATFLDSANSSLGLGTIGPVTNGDRINSTGLLERSTIGYVPVGTRSIEIALAMTRTAGAYNDGYADNLSFTLQPSAQSVPEPTPLLMLAIACSGLFAFSWWHRHRTI